MAGPPQQAPRQSRLAIHNRQRPRQAEETVPSVRVTRATRRSLCVYAVRPSRCGRGAELADPCRAALILIIRAMLGRRLLTGLLKPFGVRFHPTEHLPRSAGRLPERGCRVLWARRPRKIRGIYAKRRKHRDATRIARIAHQRGAKIPSNFKTSPELRISRETFWLIPFVVSLVWVCGR
jgi:hypothetical protein